MIYLASVTGIGVHWKDSYFELKLTLASLFELALTHHYYLGTPVAFDLCCDTLTYLH